jgi:UDP-N-acetylglucosamine 1-carboxyvinyltransferase
MKKLGHIAYKSAEGENKINRVYQIDRGYEKVVRKLACLGADIKRIKVPKA